MHTHLFKGHGNIKRLRKLLEGISKVVLQMAKLSLGSAFLVRLLLQCHVMQLIKSITHRRCVPAGKKTNKHILHGR